MLKNKNAVIYGAGGSLGGTVARAFAAAGANLFLTGRTLSNVQKVADEIVEAGGNAQADVVDAMDEQQVNEHINKVVKTGSVDISFNLIGIEAVQGSPLIEMQVADFLRPVNIAMQTQFLTGTAAARLMIKQGSGVILSLTATPGGVAYPGVGGFGPTCSAMEMLSKNLAIETGPYGVRVINIRSAGSPDSLLFKEAIERIPDVMQNVVKSMENDTMLKQLPMVDDIANVAVFMASDMASKITGVTIDVTCGSTAGLNYRTSIK